jgi:hypothetical protein
MQLHAAGESEMARGAAPCLQHRDPLPPSEQLLCFLEYPLVNFAAPLSSRRKRGLITGTNALARLCIRNLVYWFHIHKIIRHYLKRIGRKSITVIQLSTKLFSTTHWVRR